MTVWQPTTAGRFYYSFYRWSTWSNTAQTHTLSSCRRLRRPSLVQKRLECNAPNRALSTSTQHRSSAGERRPSNGSSTSTAAPEEADLSNHMRHLMRRIPHPVVVLTASFPQAPPAPTGERGGPPSSASLEASFRGMTLSSFNTVSLAPVPVVSFNVRTPSATYDAVRASGGMFLAHMLAGTQAGARVADAFTKGNSGENGGPFAELVRSRVAKVFAGRSSDGAPLILGSGVLRVLRCRLLEGKNVEVGDHVVIVAEVLGIVGDGLEKGDATDERMGLMYVDRGFKAIGEEIRIEEKSEELAAEEWKQKQAMEESFHRTLGLNVRTGSEHMDR